MLISSPLDPHDTMKPRSFVLLTGVVFASVFLPAALHAAEFSPPAIWKMAQGNPVLVGGKPQWRMDYLSPDNPLDPSAYQPMVWLGKFWAPENGEKRQSSWPRIEHNPEGPQLVTAGPWTDKKFKKIPALVFIAPVAGAYHLHGTLKAKVFTGDKGFDLLILKRTSSTVELIETVPVGKDFGVLELTQKTVNLAAGEELAIVPVVKHYHTGADVNLLEFNISN